MLGHTFSILSTLSGLKSGDYKLDYMSFPIPFNHVRQCESANITPLPTVVNSRLPASIYP